jgi:hypothetical protein
MVNGTVLMLNGQPVCVNHHDGVCIDWCHQFPPGPQYEECISTSAMCPPGQCASAVNGTTLLMNGQPVCVTVAP